MAAVDGNANKTPRIHSMADKDDRMLNSREVAFLLDLSPDTVIEFERRNIIPAFKKGATVALSATRHQISQTSAPAGQYCRGGRRFVDSEWTCAKQEAERVFRVKITLDEIGYATAAFSESCSSGRDVDIHTQRAS
jgi:hypothetical protein